MNTVTLIILLGLAVLTRSASLSLENYRDAAEILKNRLNTHEVAAAGEYSDDLDEGDMMVEQSLTRGLISRTTSAWPAGRVPYTIDSAYNSTERAKLAAAFMDFADRTCINFVPADADDTQLLVIKNHDKNGDGVPDNACNSILGRSVFNVPQNFSIGPDCFSLGTVEHELMHALGFLHEQSRSDRDSFVRINWEHIPTSPNDRTKNFVKDENSRQDSAYDYGSVMHYPLSAWSNSSADTITPLGDTSVSVTAHRVTPLQGVTIGQRNGMDDTDVAEINDYYNCPVPIFGQCVDHYTEICAEWASRCTTEAWMETYCCQTCNGDIPMTTTIAPTTTPTQSIPCRDVSCATCEDLAINHGYCDEPEFMSRLCTGCDAGQFPQSQCAPTPTTVAPSYPPRPTTYTCAECEQFGDVSMWCYQAFSTMYANCYGCDANIYPHTKCCGDPNVFSYLMAKPYQCVATGYDGRLD